MMMWSRFIRILSEMQKGSKYFFKPPKQKPQTSLAFGRFTNETNKKFCCYKLVKSYKEL